MASKILITPNAGSTTVDPTIAFQGAGVSTDVTLRVPSTGGISFEGTTGQLFSITDSMSGTIFSANDVSGIPSIEVLDTGLVKLAQYSGNVVLGSAIDNGVGKLQVEGGITMRGVNPTIYFRDTNEYSAMLHNNGNLFYLLRGATDTTTWTQVGSYWPVYWDLSNNNATFGGAIWAAGNVTAYSDAKLKENVITIDSALDKTLQLRGVYYNKKDDDTKTRKVGVIAQEIQKILPEVVMLHKDKEDPEGTLSVDYGNITGLLIEAIKEQQTIIDSQEARIARLEALINKLGL